MNRDMIYKITEYYRMTVQTFKWKWGLASFRSSDRASCARSHLGSGSSVEPVVVVILSSIEDNVRLASVISSKAQKRNPASV